MKIQTTREPSEPHQTHIRTLTGNESNRKQSKMGPRWTQDEAGNSQSEASSLRASWQGCRQRDNIVELFPLKLSEQTGEEWMNELVFYSWQEMEMIVLQMCRKSSRTRTRWTAQPRLEVYRHTWRFRHEAEGQGEGNTREILQQLQQCRNHQKHVRTTFLHWSQ